MSNIDKQALRERYSLQPVPKCHICDAVMTIARASAGAVVYACSGCTYDDNGAHYAPGRSLGDDHYSASRVTIFESGDSDVLELLDELEASQKSNKFLKEQLSQLANFNPDWDKLEAATDSLREHMAKLSAAEKRIAEHNFENRLLANADRDIKALRQRIAELEARQPYGYLRENDGQIQISIGSNRPHDRSGGYATPWFAIYTAAGIGVKGE
ncbi:ead/Ea22-like family protein [Citrobacter freundii]|uniref:ead/Ea22-like family protein n=1 Tax=Citrobacter freundii TaxID=546 RepID=UPI0023B1CA3E|nr:ead/Ea22-like family protein [Citrobacter freundii]